MNNETKVGILTLATAAILVWGYNFIKGTDILKRSNTFIVEYAHVDGLTSSSQVLINGFPVGVVKALYLKPDDQRIIVAELEVRGDINVPKTAQAVITTTSVMGGKAVVLTFGTPCVPGQDCAEDGDYLQGSAQSLVESLLGGNLQDLGSDLQQNVGGLLDTLNGRFKDPDNELGKLLADLQSITGNLNAALSSINTLVQASSAGIGQTANNLAAISGNVRDNNARITALLANLDSFSSQLASLELGNTVQNTNATIGELRQTIADLQGSLKNVETTTAQFAQIAENVNQGEGTLGKLLASDDIYVNLEKTTANLERLLQDMRLNPKRYVHFSVFGKKQKTYALPEDDPVYQREGFEQGKAGQ